MYSLSAYCNFIADSIRTDACVNALRQAVKPGDVVIDIGAGTGVFAILACRLGARKAWAIEYNNAIQLGRELALINGVSDKVEFIQDVSTKVSLPERADVIISDLRGTMPLLGQHIPSIIDARNRLLKPGGILIPQRDRLWAAIVEVPDVYEKDIATLTKSRYEMNLEPPRRFLVNQLRQARVEREQLLTEPQQCATLDYETIESTDVEASLQWTITRTGTAHGLSLWFAAELANGIGYSTAPFEPKLVYGNPFFHFQSPVAVSAGDVIRLELQARLVNDEYLWRWDTVIHNAANQLKADFKQSTFFGEILSPATLRKQAAEFVPSLNEDGEMNLFILDLMHRELPLQQIAEQVRERFPNRFRNRQEALAQVGELSAKFSR